MVIKRSVKYISLVFALLLVFCLSMMPLFNPLGAGASEGAENTAPKKTITVNGEGTVLVTPDLATITLGVSSTEKDAKTAQSKNAAAMTKVIAAVKAAGVAAADIQTSNYSIYPTYEYEQATGKRNLTGYTVSNNVIILARDLTKLGALLDAAGTAGANEAGGISYSASKKDAYYNDALKAAVQNAKSKADAIASAAGVKISTPSSITESASYASPYLVSFDSAKLAGGESIQTPVEAGTSQIRANVTVVYEY